MLGRSDSETSLEDDDLANARDGSQVELTFRGLAMTTSPGRPTAMTCRVPLPSFARPTCLTDAPSG